MITAERLDEIERAVLASMRDGESGKDLVQAVGGSNLFTTSFRELNGFVQAVAAEPLTERQQHSLACLIGAALHSMYLIGCQVGETEALEKLMQPEKKVN